MDKTVASFGVQRFWEERAQTRMVGVEYLKNNGQCLNVFDLFAGNGEGLARYYKQDFLFYISNDKEKTAPTSYHLDAMKCVETVPEILDADLIDFDAYGMCNLLVRKFIERKAKGDHFPVVICTTNALGLGLKRCNKIERIKRLKKFQFLNDDQIEKFGEKPYFDLKGLEKTFWSNISEAFNLRYEIVEMLTSKNGNFVFSTIALLGRKDA